MTNNVEINRINSDVRCERCGEELKLTDSLCGTCDKERFVIEVTCPKCEVKFMEHLTIVSKYKSGKRGYGYPYGVDVSYGNTTIGGNVITGTDGADDTDFGEQEVLDPGIDPPHEGIIEGAMQEDTKTISEEMGKSAPMSLDSQMQQMWESLYKSK